MPTGWILSAARKKSIVKMRMEGKTLSKIARHHNVEIQTVRYHLLRTLGSIPKLEKPERIAPPKKLVIPKEPKPPVPEKPIAIPPGAEALSVPAVTTTAPDATEIEYMPTFGARSGS